MTAEVAETNPDSLEASIDMNERKVILVPALLNQGDSVTIKMLVTKFENQPEVNGRIIGVKEIGKVVKRTMLKVAGIATCTFAAQIIGFLTSYYDPNIGVAIGTLAIIFVTRMFRSD